LRGVFDPEGLKAKLEELVLQADDPNLWNDQKSAQNIMREKSQTETKLKKFEEIKSGLKDYPELLEMAEMEDDKSSIAEIEKSIFDLEKTSKKFEIESMFKGEADGNNCFIEIHSGAGGTESCDWAEMLLRMYVMWAENQGFKADIVDQQEGEEAGIKSVTIHVQGQYAYGWAKSESGVHRLVRISPFDSSAKRHTSFASAWVYPEVDDSIEITIEEKDLRIDTFRSSGAGGQHVNKTESAVRITHIPTNIAVSCQTQRSQHQNRAECYKMLRARLYEVELRKREAAADIVNAQKTDNSWGNQIRSYVLHPYQMVKDLRTGFETSDTSGVLNGKLEGFMMSWLSGERRD
jgi:peptide chain release factor 2